MDDADSKKYFMFQEGDDIMFVVNVPPDQLDEAMICAFKEEARSRGLDEVILPNVIEIIREAAEGEVVRIGGFTRSQSGGEEDRPKKVEKATDPENPPFEVEVDHSAMEAILANIDRSASVSRELVDSCLERAGVRHGIIDGNIERLLVDWPHVSRVLIAQGTLPERGRDAELQLMKEVKDDLAPSISDEGVVDFKKLDLIQPIEAGEVLQLRIPPTPGVPGSDVFGRPIPPVGGKDKNLKRGENTEITEDGMKLLSTRAGFLHLSPDGKINVQPVYTVKGDVDYSTGIIEYKSDILVRGDVRAGFSVTAGGDVHIYGAMEDATVEAEGDVVINGGVLSSGKALIRAGGDVSVGFIQNATIEAGGSVYIRIEAIGSWIKAGKDVEVMKREGRIVGGELEVGGWVVSPVIGSESSPPIDIRFIASAEPSEDSDSVYDGCFVSSQALESGVRVHFGKLTAMVSGVEPPVTISIKDKGIKIENVFIGPKQLKALRKKRERDEESGE